MSMMHDTDVSDTASVIIAPHLPPAGPGGRPRSTDHPAVVSATIEPLGCLMTDDADKPWLVKKAERHDPQADTIEG